MPEELQYYVQGVLDGNRRILSKTITLIESALPDHQELGRRVIDALLPRTGGSIRLGVTGVPGVGKSTFIESLGMMLTDKGHRVGVLAVDPSSQRSGGSVMADKTRMERLSNEERAFIRPSPSGGSLGGVAGKTRETLLICEAAGFDVMIIETVGVGQSETTVASMTDFFLVLMLSGAGDELQGIKKGVLELADAVAVNKADGDNVEKARMAKKVYETALHMVYPSTPTWTPPVMTCSALEEAGVADIWDAALRHRKAMEKTGEFAEKRRKQALNWMWTMIGEGLKTQFQRHPDIRKMLPEVVAAVEAGETAPTMAAHRLLHCLDNVVQA